MRKKIRFITCLLLAAFLSFGAVGCSLIEHNYDKDYQQVAATIGVYTETRTVDGIEKTFQTKEKKIYKSQLVSSMNANASNVMSQYGYTLEQATEYLLTQLINRELILNEADRRIFFGEMKWERKDSNAVAEAVYASIDAQLKSIMNDIRKEHNEPTQPDAENTESKTTYPVPDAEEPEEEENPEKWQPDVNNYPGTLGDSNQKSLEREAVRRLVDVFEEAVKDDFVATAKEKEYFKADVERMSAFVDAHEEEKIYPMLYDPDYDPETGTGNGTYLLEYLLGRSARENRKITNLQEQITDGVYVDDREILEQYDALLTTQQTRYKTASNYKTDMTSDTANVLYTPDSNYFYVKHILVPFSDDQKAVLEAYKKGMTVSGTPIVGGIPTAAEYEKTRAALADEIVSYPHVDGEDDKTRPMTVSQIFNTITSQMSPYKYNAREAERLFDKLVYEYNTDTGAFGSVKGYAVQYELPEGEQETYMQEFADAARDMYDTLSVGQVYDVPVVTDYGVHVMYLASKTEAGAIKGLNDYQTPAEYKKVKELIKEAAVTKKEEGVFREFQEERITYYNDIAKLVERHTKRYKDLYKA